LILANVSHFAFLQDPITFNNAILRFLGEAAAGSINSAGSTSLREARITDPGNDLMLKMMRVCLGEEVAPKYAPLIREEMALFDAMHGGPSVRPPTP
jgi:hypothetical protein